MLPRRALDLLVQGQSPGNLQSPDFSSNAVGAEKAGVDGSTGSRAEGTVEIINLGLEVVDLGLELGQGARAGMGNGRRGPGGGGQIGFTASDSFGIVEQAVAHLTQMNVQSNSAADTGAGGGGGGHRAGTGWVVGRGGIGGRGGSSRKSHGEVIVDERGLCGY